MKFPPPRINCAGILCPFPKRRPTLWMGLITLGGNGDPAMQVGVAIHLYAANASMQDRFFYTADGELLIVPQLGALRFHTELGILEVAPGEICVIPRGVKFRVVLAEKQARGYICENYGLPFRLPELGPIGANGLANPRDFKAPVAAFEDRDGDSVSLRSSWDALVRGDRSLAAGRGGLAWQLRSLQVRSGAVQLHQHRLVRSSRIRRSTPCSARRQRLPAPPIATSRSFLRAGWWRSTPSVRRGSIAT